MKAFTKKDQLKNSYNTTIFSNIYKNNSWGGKKGEFHSGPGSHNNYIRGYTEVVANFILENKVQRIVEIGCGDFNVSNNILTKLDENTYDYEYTGYDVVKPLIERNKSLFGSSKINFIRKDSCVGTIKGGDLLIVRQVMQHLNNNSVKQIVDKFPNYKFVIFTEHQASEKYGDRIVPNIDQPTGASIRLGIRSGVYLDKEPFNCKIDSKLFAILQWDHGLEAYINTYLVKNQQTKDDK